MKNLTLKLLFTIVIILIVPSQLNAQEGDGNAHEDANVIDTAAVKNVYIIFKTHLDIGFTDLSSNVEKKYIKNFIPDALKVSEELRKRGTGENYVWTTGSWLVWTYLNQASPEAVKDLKKAIERGDIVWNGVPYTVQSESMSRDLFSTTLDVSKELDKMFGKKTTGAKFTDVPGHTRGIVGPLSNAGIKFLHIGINGASMNADLPPLFRWQDNENKEIIVMYQGTYGSDMLLPDGKSIVSIRLTGDNQGAHRPDRVISFFDELKKKYPNANIRSTSLNEVQSIVEGMKGLLPVIKSEIGDTWIYGYASAPLRMARYRAISRLYSKWLKEDMLEMHSPTAMTFALRLGMVAEHTWGGDTKKYLKNWDLYDVDAFNKARREGVFDFIQTSWAEQDAYVDQAIALLPPKLQAEANNEIKNIGKVTPVNFSNRKENINDLSSSGALHVKKGGMEMTIGTLAYQTFSFTDYEEYRDRYMRHDKDWTLTDFGKPGLQRSKAESATVTPEVKYSMLTNEKEGKKISCELEFPEHKSFDKRVYPEKMYVEYFVPKTGNSIDVNVSIVNKPAVRLAEAYWFSFIPEHIISVIAEKTGERVDVIDVVKNGARQMHGIDEYIDIITTNGTVRITSYDAPVVTIGERNALNFSKRLPDITKGVHFCLSNNLWGTNFKMWNEGSLTYRFKLEFLTGMNI
jgi:hypothetical protein